MLVPQRDIVHGAAFDRGLECGEPDQRRLVLVGFEDVDAAVSDDDAGDAVGRQPVEHVGNQVAGGLLGPPRRGDDLQAGPHLVHACPVENRDVVRAFGGEQRAGVHRRRIERIVVAGQQVHRNADGAHGFQRLADVTRRELVVLEDIAGDDDELGAASAASGPMPATTSRRAAEYRGCASPFRK